MPDAMTIAPVLVVVVNASASVCVATPVPGRYPRAIAEISAADKARL
jgi:hypothetical protein